MTFFPLTEVDLGGGPLAFLAVRASAIHAVVPTCRIEELLLPGIRTSDYLGHQEGFIPLRGCRIVPGAPGLSEPLDTVFVDARAVIAVAEEEPDDAARADP